MTNIMGSSHGMVLEMYHWMKTPYLHVYPGAHKSNTFIQSWNYFTDTGSFLWIKPSILRCKTVSCRRLRILHKIVLLKPRLKTVSLLYTDLLIGIHCIT